MLICCQRSGRPGQVSTICLHHDIKIAKWHKVLQAFWAIWAQSTSPVSESPRVWPPDKLRILLTDTTNTLPH
jgi:hypothetical protein